MRAQNPIRMLILALFAAQFNCAPDHAATDVPSQASKLAPQELEEYVSASRETRIELLAKASPEQQLQLYLARYWSRHPPRTTENLLLIRYTGSLAPALAKAFRDTTLTALNAEALLELLQRMAQLGDYDFKSDVALRESVQAGVRRLEGVDPRNMYLEQDVALFDEIIEERDK